MFITKAIKEGLKSTTDVDDFSSKLLSFLKENHLLHLLPNILNKLEMENKKEKELSTILIKTSHEFSEKTLEKIKERFGREKGGRFKVEIDNSIIGGFIASGQNKVIDASVKRNIVFLKELLTK